MHSLDVVVALLQERSQEVEGHHDVGLEFIISHGHITHSVVHAGNFLELELDGGSGISDLVGKRGVVVNLGWESLDSVKDWSNHNWNLLKH